MSRIPYYLASIYVGLYFIRPFEWQGALYGIPLLQILGVMILIVLGFEGLTGRLKFFETGSDLMFIGFICSIFLSQLFSDWPGGVVSVVQKMLPVVAGYFIIRRSLDSKSAVKQFIVMLSLILAFIGYEGWRQYTTGMSHGGMTPYSEGQTVEGENEISTHISRIRWYGVFNDPNDLALGLVIIVPFLLERLIRKEYLLPLITIIPVIIALYFTNSRGGMLACAVGIASFYILKFRSKRSALIALLLASTLLVLGPSRMGGFSSDDESANGRIESWYQGYQMLKTHPVLGVSMNRYTDYNELTAHNSFILVLAELGIVGVFFFTGMFYFPFKWLVIRLKSPYGITNDDWGVVCATFGSLISLMTAMFFLSRSYVMLPYLVLALILSTIQRFGGEYLDKLLPAPQDYKYIFFVVLGGIVGINVVVKMFL